MAEGSRLEGYVPEGIWEKRLQGCVHRGGPGGLSGEKISERKPVPGPGKRAWGAAFLRVTRAESRAASPALPRASPLPGPPEAADVTTNNPSLCVGVGRGRDRLNSSFSGCAARLSPTKGSGQGKPPSTLTRRPSWRPLASVGGLLPCAVTED